ncbi:DNA/RNA non-specific endonuclease [Olsenella profusa]|uniref:DNA/RNA non-specific endonuclease n=1 Tax=Olsenella profusa TaxID=138595 RepID=A0ABS2F083_9ACTN|nr:DNA/RNA non-specific endonuclease [Olsenella profusa]MBM6773993.1 DNA/RNA non-specific endonuclease [Olsenella profusa]
MAYRGLRPRAGAPSAGRLRARSPLALVFALAVTLTAGIGTGALPSLGSMPTPATSVPASASFDEGVPGTWDAEAYPEYYRVLGPAVVSDEPAPGEARYEGLDDLGRTGAVTATVTYDMMEAGSDRERADISDIHPSGWGHNEEVDIPMPDGTSYHGYLFNRSHLLAKSLGGADAAENLVTGTRTQNVGDNHGQDGGMAYAEGLAREWLRAHPDGTVYYRATPVYVGSELVPRSVVVDVRSSDGSLDQEVEVFNAATGFKIDYATGAFTAD